MLDRSYRMGTQNCGIWPTLTRMSFENSGTGRNRWREQSSASFIWQYAGDLAFGYDFGKLQDAFGQHGPISMLLACARSVTIPWHK